MLTGVGNILPFATTDTNSSTNSTTSTRRRKRDASSGTTTTVSPDTGNGTEPLYIPTCCENVTAGLCDWIEPVGWMCVDEEDRKKTVWTEDDCLLVYPDDINSITDRYDAWKGEKKRQANELVRPITSILTDVYTLT
jgi:hypothetical protein